MTLSYSCSISFGFFLSLFLNSTPNAFPPNLIRSRRLLGPSELFFRAVLHSAERQSSLSIGDNLHSTVFVLQRLRFVFQKKSGFRNRQFFVLQGKPFEKSIDRT